jgi:hypothetical protein
MSNVLLPVLIIASIFALGANIWYPLAKDSERKATLARAARELLSPEIEHNAITLSKVQSRLKSSDLPDPEQTFDVMAWETISKGGLLEALVDNQEAAKLLQIYRLTYKVNNLINEIIKDTKANTQGERYVAGQFMNEHLVALRTTLEELKNAFAAWPPR